MKNEESPQTSFATTRWSLVIAAGGNQHAEARLAFTKLCETYWIPLYAFALRRVNNVDDAQDLTQAFFTELLEKNSVGVADAGRGRFRAFLVTAFKHFMSKERDKGRAQKRGGGRTILSLDFSQADSSLRIEPTQSQTAEQLYDQEWAITLLRQVMDGLRAEFVAKRKVHQFEVLRVFLGGEPPSITYAQAAMTLGMTESTAKKAASRLRHRYRQLLRDEIGQTVDGEQTIDDEIRCLFTVLAK